MSSVTSTLHEEHKRPYFVFLLYFRWEQSRGNQHIACWSATYQMLCRLLPAVISAPIMGAFLCRYTRNTYELWNRVADTQLVHQLLLADSVECSDVPERQVICQTDMYDHVQYTWFDLECQLIKRKVSIKNSFHRLVVILIANLKTTTCHSMWLCPH